MPNDRNDDNQSQPNNSKPNQRNLPEAYDSRLAARRQKEEDFLRATTQQARRVGRDGHDEEDDARRELMTTRRQEAVASRRRRSKASPKDKNRPSAENELLPSLRPTSVLGDFFYSMGMYAECYVMQVWRLLRDAGMFFGQIIVWLFGGVFSKTFFFVVGVLKDLLSPIFGIFKGIFRIFQVASGKKDVGSTKGRTTVSGYMKHGLRSYWQIMKNLFRLVLPLGGAAVLLVSMFGLLNREYALAVHVNSEFVGYVANEAVMDGAAKILRDRLSLSADQTADAWTFSPELTIVPAKNLSTQIELADEILRTSPNEIIEAKGLYIDGALYSVTTDGDALAIFLQEALEARRTMPEASLSFVRDVRVSEGSEVFLVESVRPISDIQALLETNIAQAVEYIADGKMRLSAIATETGVTIEQLIARNPSLEGKNGYTVLAEGTVLILAKAVPFLQVKEAFRKRELVEIEFETVETNDMNMALGTKRITQQGKNGEKEVDFDYIYIDGEFIEKKEIVDTSTILRDAVERKVSVGSNSAVSPSTTSGGGGGGAFAGSYLWPLPGVQYSSRGYIPGVHRALDLNAATGTAIFASNAGIVVHAGWGGLYGLMVKIEHPDGKYTLYAHCVALYVVQGQEVGAGALIAGLGSTGNSTGPHLHFEIIVDGVPIDPYNYVIPPFPLGRSPSA